MSKKRTDASRQELQRVLRFLIAGVANTIFGYAAYALLVLAALPSQLALLFAFAAGVAFNFFTTTRFVFAKRGFDQLPTYVAIYGAIYICNALVLHVAITSGVGPLLAQAFILPLTALATYLAMRRLFST